MSLRTQGDRIRAYKYLKGLGYKRADVAEFITYGIRKSARDQRWDQGAVISMLRELSDELDKVFGKVER